MGASSVTGVGQGSADKAGQKGSEHLWVGVEKLIGPRVVHAGRATIGTVSTGVIAVKFPVPLPGVVTDYIVLVSGGANYAYVTSFTVDGFTINGTDTQVASYAVIRVDAASAASQVVPTGGNVAY